MLSRPPFSNAAQVASLVHQQNLPVGLDDSRGKHPTRSGLDADKWAGGSPASAGGLGGADGSVVSLIGLAAEGEADEFGEMTSASPEAAAGDAEGKGGGTSRPSIIRLSATSGAAGSQGGASRRVQFADDSTVIDVRSSDDGGGTDAGPVALGTAAPGGLEYRRQPSLLEVELASGASPLISPRDGPSSSYSSWLHD